MKKALRCLICHQDLREPPHEGLHGKDCPMCGQGISWRHQKRVGPCKIITPWDKNLFAKINKRYEQSAFPGTI